MVTKRVIKQVESGIPYIEACTLLVVFIEERQEKVPI